MSEQERDILNNAVNANQINVDAYKYQAMREEVEKYKQTPYFNNYLGYCNGADVFSQEQLNQYKMLYMANLSAFKNPFYQGTKRWFFLKIGYPVPSYCLNTLCEAYKKAFAKNNDIEGSEVTVDITPLEYSKIGNNMIKHSQGYQLQIQLVKKLEKMSERSK